MSLVATLSSWEQTAYVTRAYADAYFVAHPEATRWSDLADAVKDGCLIAATRALDSVSYFACGARLYGAEAAPYAQALRLPLATHATIDGTASGGTTLTLIDADFADSSAYRDDYFKYGAVRITSGTNANTVREISAFDVATGTVTVTSAWNAAIDTCSEYTIIYPLRRSVRDAVCEFALEISKGGYGEAQEAMQAGVQPNALSSMIPKRVEMLLGDYIARSANLKRF